MLALAALVGLLAGCGAHSPAAAPPRTPPTPDQTRTTTANPTATPDPLPGTAAQTGSQTTPPPQTSQAPAPSTDATAGPGAPSLTRTTTTLPLTGKVVVLDPGHNGGNGAHPGQINRLVDAGGIRKPCNTTGTSSNSGYPEHALTWAVAQEAATQLRARGATVVLTRGNDTGVGPCIDQRAALADAAHPDATVSIHADGGPARGRGFHVIAPALAPDRGNPRVLAPSRALATDLKAAFTTTTGMPFSTYTGSAGLTVRNDLGGLNLARTPTVFLEMGNMRNATDAGLFTSAAWRTKAGLGIAEGITAYLTR
jgi:N-acetylmuramoyl-L-alanine amidase